MKELVYQAANMHKASNYGLLIVDIQGKLAELVDNSDEMISNTAKLIKCCQILSIPVVVLEQNPTGLGPTTVSLKECIDEYAPLEKYTFSGMAESHIKEAITSLNKKTWLVAGIEAHICVYQTVRDLLKENLSVEVVSDCISSRRKSNLDLAIENMRHEGAKITSVEMAIYETMQSSKASEFKDVLKVIK